MESKFDIFKITNTKEAIRQNEVDDVLDISMKFFWFSIIYVTLNYIAKVLIHDVWGEIIPLLMYLTLLFSVCLYGLWYHKKHCGKFKLPVNKMSVIFKYILLVNGSYFLGIGFRGDNAGAFSIAFTCISLYFGFAISLDELLQSKEWNDISRCFFKVLYNSIFNTKYSVVMLILLFLFGVLGFYSDKEIILVLVAIICSFVLSVTIVFCIWRTNLIRLMCQKLVPVCRDKQVLILHAGNNLALLNGIEKKVKNLKQIESLQEYENEKRYDVVLVLNSCYSRNSNEYTFDSIKVALKSNGIIIDPFINVSKQRNACYAWLGVPKYFTLFNSLDEYKSC